MNLTLKELRTIFKKSGAVRILAKPLAENDNTKQQLYLGSSFDVVSDLPFREVTPDSAAQNLKAKLNFFWLAENGDFEQAEHAQIILYPQYPEVRLSGFMRGCSAAPSAHMQPIPSGERGPKNTWDGRVLYMGVTENKIILAYLSIRGSAASCDFEKLCENGDIQKIRHNSVLYELGTEQVDESRSILLETLAEIKRRGWIDSVRMYPDGSVRSYGAQNGGGYTLEAMLGIIPNGRSEPDFHGWEIKAYSQDRITLMTPEPDGGHYGNHGAGSFVRNYGYERDDKVWYFTGVHRVGEVHEKTKQKLTLEGFDAEKGKIFNVNGGITLSDSSGDLSAVWTYSGLINHWGRKHANAAYVKYEVNKENEASLLYRYASPVKLGVGTNFEKYLLAMHAGTVVYDPATKIAPATGSRGSAVKARNQFRISVRNLPALYDEFKAIDF